MHFPHSIMQYYFSIITNANAIVLSDQSNESESDGTEVQQLTVAAPSVEQFEACSADAETAAEQCEVCLPICSYYLRNKCAFGDNCHYRHPAGLRQSSWYSPYKYESTEYKQQMSFTSCNAGQRNYEETPWDRTLRHVQEMQMKLQDKAAAKKAQPAPYRRVPTAYTSKDLRSDPYYKSKSVHTAHKLPALPPKLATNETLRQGSSPAPTTDKTVRAALLPTPRTVKAVRPALLPRPRINIAMHLSSERRSAASDSDSQQEEVKPHESTAQKRYICNDCWSTYKQKRSSKSSAGRRRRYFSVETSSESDSDTSCSSSSSYASLSNKEMECASTSKAAMLTQRESRFSKTSSAGKRRGARTSTYDSKAKREHQSKYANTSYQKQNALYVNKKRSLSRSSSIEGTSDSDTPHSGKINAAFSPASSKENTKKRRCYFNGRGYMLTDREQEIVKKEMKRLEKLHTKTLLIQLKQVEAEIAMQKRFC